MSVKEQVVEELHKPARKHYKRRRVVIKGLNDLFQADLVEMIPYAGLNRGFRYILVVIDTFSKYVWASPVKRKTGKEVATAMLKVLQTLTPRNLQTDMGKEFYNEAFQKLMAKFNINHYSTYSNLKASIVERCNRTLKNMMWKQFSLQGTYKWLHLLPKIVHQYNTTKHRTTGLKPAEVNRKKAAQLLRTVYNRVKTIDPRKPKLRIGDHVRVSKHRAAFSKGYTPSWSNEVFTVAKVRLTNPTTYLLEDETRQQIKGGFYEQELQKTQYPDVYLVEKVLKRKGDQLYVKWLGLDKQHNSWIRKGDIA